VPEYEDLVARAPAAQERARSLTLDAARVSSLARILRRRSTHGICPDCFERVNRDAAAIRAEGGEGSVRKAAGK